MRPLRLTNRFFLIAAALIGMSFFVAVVPPIKVAVGFFWLALVAVAILDSAPLWRVPKLRPKVSVARGPELGKEVKITCSLHLGESALPARFRLLAPTAPNLMIEMEAFEVTQLGEGKELAVEGKITARAVRLGFAEIKEVGLELRSRLGLWRRNLSLPLSHRCEYRVMPSRQAPPLQWMKDHSSVIAGLSGNRRVKRGNEPDLFHSLREYQYGDSRRFLDAKKWAKLGKPMTKTYETEKRHHVVVALDLGQAMKGSIGTSEKLDYYLALAMVILENAIASGDSASFVSFSRDLHCLLPQIRSGRDLDSLFRRGPELETRETLTDFQLLGPALTRTAPRRAIVILLTDLSRPSLHEPIRTALGPISQKHLVIAVSLQDRAHSIEELVLGQGADPLDEEKVAQLLYTCWIDDQLALFRSSMRSLGVPALTVPEDYWLAAVTRLYQALRTSSMA